MIPLIWGAQSNQFIETESRKAVTERGHLRGVQKERRIRAERKELAKKWCRKIPRTKEDWDFKLQVWKWRRPQGRRLPQNHCPPSSLLMTLQFKGWGSRQRSYGIRKSLHLPAPGNWTSWLQPLITDCILSPVSAVLVHSGDYSNISETGWLRSKKYLLIACSGG